MTVDEDVLYFLEHSGVKGMRWGVRKKANESNSKLSPQAKRNLKIVAGISAGAAVLAGSIFVSHHMSSNGARMPISQAARIVDSNPGHAREAARIRADMSRMYSEISSEFRQVERAIDPRFISDPSVFRWPQSFGT